jgi:hypothetical protein
MTTKRGFQAAAMLTAMLCAAVGLSMLLRSKVTRAEFCRLQNGMTPAQVEEIFGVAPDPWIFSGSHRSREIPLKWSGDGTARVMFDSDRGLVHKLWSEEGFSSPTRRNFDRVAIGMTVTEVKDIFGKQPDSYWCSPNEVTTGRWHDIDGCGWINFDRGQASEKGWEGNSPEVRATARTILKRFLHLIHPT